ncbi:MAG TPA: DUF2459 domain-containing protein [Candidatus Binatia bacterium]|nr:DUF2459 domain-containing protein [Candidatus Binatia bacterium]
MPSLFSLRAADRLAGAVFVVLLAIACARPISELQFQGDKIRRIFVVNYGWHTAIVIKKSELSEKALPEVREFPDADYLEIGWGDRDYYQAADAGLGLALRAAFWSSGSVLHVVGIQGAAERHFAGSEIVEIMLGDQMFQRLSEFISGTFLRFDPAAPAEGRPGQYPTSQFYPARGKFHLFHTCNTWVAEALGAAGLPISPAFTFTAGSLMSRVKRFDTKSS